MQHCQPEGRRSVSAWWKPNWRIELICSLALGSLCSKPPPLHPTLHIYDVQGGASPFPHPFPSVLQSVSPADSKRLLWPPQDPKQKNPSVKLPNPTCKAVYQDTHYYKLTTTTVSQGASCKQNTGVLRPSFPQPLSLIISHTMLPSIPHALTGTCARAPASTPPHFLHTSFTPTRRVTLACGHATRYRHSPPMRHAHIRLQSKAFIVHHDLDPCPRLPSQQLLKQAVVLCTAGWYGCIAASHEPTSSTLTAHFAPPAWLEEILQPSLLPGAAAAAAAAAVAASSSRS